MFEIKELKDVGEFFVEKLVYIQELYVIDEKRNIGIAKGMINEIDKYAISNNIKKVILTSREITFGFYRKLGYKNDDSYECRNKLKCFIKELS